MPETIPPTPASCSKVPWDPVPRHRTTVPVAAGPSRAGVVRDGFCSWPWWGRRWCRWSVWCHRDAQRVGFGDGNILGVLRCRGGMLWQHCHTQL